MCDECRQSPCHPRCPNASEPPTVCHCDECGDAIHDGKVMYVVGSNNFCKRCIDGFKTYAECDYDD